jgi:hypothetical protein
MAAGMGGRRACTDREGTVCQNRFSMGLRDLERLAFRVVRVVILLGVGLFAYGAAPAAASDEFYSTSAQVVPVFLLTLVLETRTFRVDQPGTSPLFGLDGWLSVLVFGVFMAAEFTSLSAVATAGHADGDPGLVYMAIAIGAFSVLAVAMFGRQIGWVRLSWRDAGSSGGFGDLAVGVA